MNSIRRLAIAICAMAFLFLLVTLLVMQQFVSETNAEELIFAADTTPITNTLVVAIGEEPDSLFVYGAERLTSKHIFSAIMDGPFTNLNFDGQPVIIESIPRLDNGGAVLQEVTVNTGDSVVDASGNVVVLANGDEIFNSNGDRITFQGTPIFHESNGGDLYAKKWHLLVRQCPGNGRRFNIWATNCLRSSHSCYKVCL